MASWRLPRIQPLVVQKCFLALVISSMIGCRRTVLRLNRICCPNQGSQTPKDYLSDMKAPLAYGRSNLPS